MVHYAEYDILLAIVKMHSYIVFSIDKVKRSGMEIFLFQFWACGSLHKFLYMSVIGILIFALVTLTICCMSLHLVGV